MACYWPMPAYDNGRGQVTLSPPVGTSNLALPCGRCIGCRADKATEWALRSEHEASLYRYNTFLTLTYADDKLPASGLRPDHFRNFIKRLRKRITSNNDHRIMRDRGNPVRYFACGEYGEKTGRAHYHALLYNAGFRDSKPVGTDLYESETIGELWPHGMHKLRPATTSAANYIAQYTLKKQGEANKYQYGGRPYLQPGHPSAPFLRMSLKPALGAAFVAAYSQDLTKGYLVTDGVKHAIPRHYRTLLKRSNPMLDEQITATINKQRRDNPTDRDDADRRAAAENIHYQQKQQQERKL